MHDVSRNFMKQKHPIYKIKHRSGNTGWLLDLGRIDGKPKRLTFKTKIEAQTASEKYHALKVNQGTRALSLANDVREDAVKADDLLSPHGVSIWDAARYYDQHVLRYKNSPPVAEIVQRLIDDRESLNRRDRTISDLRSRLGIFAEKFGDSKLHEITLDELKSWLNDADHEWKPRTRNNFLTKLSQLYNFAFGLKWVDSNPAALIERASADDTKAEIFTVAEAEKLLTHANQFNLLPYIALGLFAGIRSAEMERLNGKAVNFDAKNITVSGDVAKKRGQRQIDMQPALLAWLEPVREKLQSGVPVVERTSFFFRKDMAQLREAAGIENWPDNGLRHSFGSYHFEMFESEDKTAKQMGNSPTMVHRHYKSIVSKGDAEKFWALRPAIT
jgi:integrase